jgi:hypothetical protein
MSLIASCRSNRPRKGGIVGPPTLTLARRRWISFSLRRIREIRGPICAQFFCGRLMPHEILTLEAVAEYLHLTATDIARRVKAKLFVQPACTAVLPCSIRECPTLTCVKVRSPCSAARCRKSILGLRTDAARRYGSCLFALLCTKVYSGCANFLTQKSRERRDSQREISSLRHSAFLCVSALSLR